MQRSRARTGVGLRRGLLTSVRDEVLDLVRGGVHGAGVSGS